MTDEEVDRVRLIRASLLTQGVQFYSVEIASHLKMQELMQLFDDLLYLATIPVRRAKELIKHLPRDWVLERIEDAAEPYLRDGTDWEYRRLLELYSELDPDLTRKLATRAAQHSDSEIREAGEDCLDWLSRSQDEDTRNEDPTGDSGNRTDYSHRSE